MNQVASVDVLGVEFYPVTLAGSLETIKWMLSRRDGRTRLVVTANPIMVMTAQKDSEFKQILHGADLIVPDGFGVIWASRRLGRALPERVTGVDLAFSLLRHKPPLRFFFLGGKPGVAERARDEVQKSFPGVNVVGTYHGYFGADDESRVVELIRATKADVLFVCLGSPKQEKFIWRHREELGAKVALGLGGVLDVLSGEKKRAPQFVQKAGLEWLYRLVKEPKRFRNDLLLLEFAILVQLRAMKRQRQEQGASKDDGFEYN